MMRRAERKIWATAETLADLAELTARWLEGELRSQPGYMPNCGPDSETTELIPILARVNRAGFLTDNSQPGIGEVVGYDGTTWTQRAALDGWISPERAEGLVTAAREAGLVVITHTVPRWFALPDSSSVDVTLREGRVFTQFGCRWRRREIERRFRGCSDAAIDAVIGAVQITIADPEYGPHDWIWTFLDEWAGRHRVRPSPAG